MDAPHDEYTGAVVPLASRGSAWKIFFIVTGTMCGLPTFVLSARIMASLGMEAGSVAILAGAGVTALLASLTSFLGASSGMSLALLSERSFGSLGARMVKILIALSLIGWFGSIIGLLGMTAGTALHEQFGLTIPPDVIASIMGIVIITVTCFGARGLENIGKLVIPVAMAGVMLCLVCTLPMLRHGLRVHDLAAELDMGGTISAMVGSYVVGIIIQPDYSRFVRSPRGALLATSLSLGVAYPLIMIGAGIPTFILGKADLVAALTQLGFGLPALGVLVFSAWIDAAACLYSGSLAIANQVKSRRLVPCIIGAGLIGLAIDLSGIAGLYVHFLLLLGIALPPIAAILIIDGFRYRREQTAVPVLRPVPLVAWVAGILAGTAGQAHIVSLTGVATFDALAVTSLIALAGIGLEMRNDAQDLAR